jgi:DNA-binding transcriptional MocR family regulator
MRVPVTAWVWKTRCGRRCWRLLHSCAWVPVALAVDAQGMCVPADGVLRSCAAVVLTPRAQHPTGVAMTAAAGRTHALRACPHTLLILDDHWGPLSAAPLAMAGTLPPLWLHVLSVSSHLGAGCRVAVVSGTPGSVQGMCAPAPGAGPRAASR